MLILIAVSLIIVITTYEIWRRSRSPFGLPKVSFSWPKPIPYFIHYFTSNGKTISSVVSSYRAKYGDIFVMPIMNTDCVVLTGEEGVNWAAKQERDDNFAREFSYNGQKLFGNNQNRDIAAKKDVWKNFRATVSPALMQSSVINNFCPTMVQVIDKHLSQTNVIDAEVLSAITFEVGWLFLVGKRGFESRQQVRELYKDFRMAITSLPFDLPGTQLRKGIEARAKIAATVNKIVEDDPTAIDDPNCSLSLILNGNQAAASRLVGLLFAATDTTTMTLSGLLWHIIENSAITKELQKEIRDNPDPQSLGDFQKFTYLNKFVQEALRLYGVDFVFRSAKTVLQYKNIQFPAGTLFAIITGYDHSSVKNPQQFDPEREEKYKLEPFGTPARNCLGKVFAQFQIKMILQRILKYYNVVGEKDEGASVRQGFSVRLNNARLKLARPV